MSKNKQQGTAWETSLVRRAEDFGLKARRLAEAGSNDQGDVYIEGEYDQDPIIAVAWKRLVDKGGAKRQPDGEPAVVVVSVSDFLDLLSFTQWAAVVECKATERLNVTRTLAKARKKATRNER